MFVRDMLKNFLMNVSRDIFNRSNLFVLWLL